MLARSRPPSPRASRRHTSTPVSSCVVRRARPSTCRSSRSSSRAAFAPSVSASARRRARPRRHPPRRRRCPRRARCSRARRGARERPRIRARGVCARRERGGRARGGGRVSVGRMEEGGPRGGRAGKTPSTTRRCLGREIVRTRRREGSVARRERRAPDAEGAPVENRKRCQPGQAHRSRVHAGRRGVW